MIKTTIGIAIASTYGLLVRLLFGLLGDFMNIMSLSFLVLLPMLIGFVTVMLMPKRKVSRTSAFFMPWATSFVILVITMMFGIEGSVCWILMYPLFAIFAGLGGFIAYRIRKKDLHSLDKDVDSIGRKDDLNVSFILLFIPLVAGFFEKENLLHRKEIQLEKSIVLNAAPEKVWGKIISINEITPGETHTGVAGALGFPKHVQTLLDTLAIGSRRSTVYQNGLVFEEVVTGYEAGKQLALAVKTDASKIPPAVMDEHIAIGGKYVDILEDTYHLELLAGGKTRLSLSSRFMINTPFNWYAGIWAKYIMGDILKSELGLVEARLKTE